MNDQAATISRGFSLIRNDLERAETIALLDSLEEAFLLAIRTVDKVDSLFSAPGAVVAAGVLLSPERSERVLRTAGAEDMFSRKVPDVPALRLAGWESDARSISLPDVGGLQLGDPRIDTLKEEGAL